MYVLPKLPFADSALEPYISSETIHFHYGKHHAKYVEKLNSLLISSPLENLSIFDLLAFLVQSRKNGGNVDSRFDEIEFNAFQHFNHCVMWSLLGPTRDIQPPAALVSFIKSRMGSWENFEKQFTNAAMSGQGSGWVFLTFDQDLNLEARWYPNHTNPLMDEGVSGSLIAIDMWEHSYYLDYQSDKQKYVSGFLKSINWDAVFERVVSFSALFSEGRF